MLVLNSIKKHYLLCLRIFLPFQISEAACNPTYHQCLLEALVQGLRTAFGVVVPALALTWAYLGRSIVRWTLALRTRVRESAMF